VAAGAQGRRAAVSSQGRRLLLIGARHRWLGRRMSGCVAGRGTACLALRLDRVRSGRGGCLGAAATLQSDQNLGRRRCRRSSASLSTLACGGRVAVTRRLPTHGVMMIRRAGCAALDAAHLRRSSRSADIAAVGLPVHWRQRALPPPPAAAAPRTYLGGRLARRAAAWRAAAPADARTPTTRLGPISKLSRLSTD
jgi:hypothetical protein